MAGGLGEGGRGRRVGTTKVGKGAMGGGMAMAGKEALGGGMVGGPSKVPAGEVAGRSGLPA